MRKTSTAMMTLSNGVRREDKCDDCSVKSPTMFILKDEIWQSISPNKELREYICFNCAQKRLGRIITLDDMKDCPATGYQILGIRIYLQSSKHEQDLIRDILSSSGI